MRREKRILEHGLVIDNAVRRRCDVQNGSEDSREALDGLLYLAVGPMPAHLGKELCIPQAEIGTPSCEGIQGDKKSGPSLAQADLVQLRLTLLNVRSESCEDLTNVFRLFLRSRSISNQHLSETMAAHLFEPGEEAHAARGVE